MSEPFIAEVRIFAGNYAPRGWAFCNGQLLQIAQNTALFSLLGTIYGGDGRTTYALPDLRAKTPMHAGQGQGPGLTPRIVGEEEGTDYVTLQTHQIPPHNHDYHAIYAASTENVPNSSLGLASGVAGSGKGSSNVALYNNTATNMVDMASQAIGNAGGGQPHYNMQPYLVVNYIIALIGLYPSRN